MKSIHRLDHVILDSRDVTQRKTFAHLPEVYRELLAVLCELSGREPMLWQRLIWESPRPERPSLKTKVLRFHALESIAPVARSFVPSERLGVNVLRHSLDLSIVESCPERCFRRRLRY